MSTADQRRAQRQAEREARRAAIGYRQSPGIPYLSKVERERRFQPFTTDYLRGRP